MIAKPKQKTIYPFRNCADTTIFLKSIGWKGSKSRSIAHSSLSQLSLSQCSHCDAPVSPSTVHTHAQRPVFAPHRTLIVGRDLLSSTKLWVVGTAELSPKNFHAGRIMTRHPSRNIASMIFVFACVEWQTVEDLIARPLLVSCLCVSQAPRACVCFWARGIVRRHRHCAVAVRSALSRTVTQGGGRGRSEVPETL